jgi:hypothetical protein
MAQTIQFKRGNELNLPTLEVGEPAITTDSTKLFFGTPIGNIEVAKKEEVTELGKYQSDYVNLEKFKLPNETTYDNAFVKAIAYMKANGVNILLLPTKGEIVLENNPVVLDIPYMAVIGTSIKEQGANIVGTRGGYAIFDVNEIGISFNNIVFEGRNPGMTDDYASRTVDGIRYVYSHPDMDTFIKGCTFVNFNRGIEFKGRNLRVGGSIFAQANVAIRISKHEESTNIYGNDIRGIMIDNGNIFHTVGTSTRDAVCIEVVDYTPGQNISIKNNLFEQGTCKVFKGHINGVEFTNNQGAGLGGSEYLFEIYDGVAGQDGLSTREWVISDNFFICPSGAESNASTHNFIYAQGDLITGKIVNNTFMNCDKEAIKVLGVVSTCSIKDNRFYDMGRRGTDGANHAIAITGNVYNSVIKDNEIIGNSAKKLTKAFQFIAPIDNNTRIINNHVLNSLDSIPLVKHEEGTLTLMNSWVALDNTTYPVKLRTNGSECWLEGFITGGGTTLGNTIATFPITYKPNSDRVFTVAVYNGTAYSTGVVTVTKLGEVKVGNLPSNNRLILDSVRWNIY